MLALDPNWLAIWWYSWNSFSKTLTVKKQQTIYIFFILVADQGKLWFHKCTMHLKEKAWVEIDKTVHSSIASIFKAAPYCVLWHTKLCDWSLPTAFLVAPICTWSHLTVCMITPNCIHGHLLLYTWSHLTVCLITHNCVHCHMLLFSWSHYSHTLLYTCLR